jgi:phage-related protein
MSLRTGVSVENLSTLAYAAKQSGTDIESVETSLKFLTKAMVDTAVGTGPAKDTFAALGVSVVDTEGKLRPTIDVMKDVATAVAAIKNPVEQADIAMQLFGARSGTQLVPLLKEGEVGIDALMGKAKDLGIEMSTKSAQAADVFKDKMSDLTGSLAGVGRTIGDVLIPALQPLIDKAIEIVGKIQLWAEENPKLVETITKISAVVGVVFAVGGPILMAVAAISKIGGAISALMGVGSPLGLLVLAITGLVLIWKNWDTISAFVEGWKDKILGFLTDLKDSAVLKITEMIDWIVQKFEDLANLPKKMLDWGKNAISGFADGIKSTTGKVTDAVKNVGQGIKNFLGFESPPKEGPLSASSTWMPNMMAMFGAGITTNLSVVLKPVEALSTGISEIFNTLKDDLESTVGTIVGYLEDNLSNAIYGLLSGKDEIKLTWASFWEGLKDILIKAVAAMIAKLIILATFSWLFKLFNLPLSWLGLEKGGGVGYELGGGVKGFANGELGTDTVPAMLTPGEYVIDKPMVDAIKRLKAIPVNLISAIATGMPTPAAAFAGGGMVSIPNAGYLKEYEGSKIYVDIHDNKISDEIDVRKLAVTVSDEILRKINQNRRY